MQCVVIHPFRMRNIIARHCFCFVHLLGSNSGLPRLHVVSTLYFEDLTHAERYTPLGVVSRARKTLDAYQPLLQIAQIPVVSSKGAL
jgi:hypothetical protein